jgi:hypothetical protein
LPETLAHESWSDPLDLQGQIDELTDDTALSTLTLGRADPLDTPAPDAMWRHVLPG